MIFFSKSASGSIHVLIYVAKSGQIEFSQNGLAQFQKFFLFWDRSDSDLDSVRKVYEIFKILKVQKRMVSAQIILGNTVHKKIMY